MSDETAKNFLPSDIVGYPEIFAFCANLVAASEHPRLAVTVLHNAILQISLETLGREKLERDLLGVIENLPMAEAQARGRLD